MQSLNKNVFCVQFPLSSGLLMSSCSHSIIFLPPGPPAAGPPPGQNLPGEDVHENAGAEAPQPSAPDPSKMDHVSGYDNVGFNTNAGEGL